MPANANDNFIAATETTTKEPSTTLNDIYISVKTGYNYHETRLALILRTWYQLAAAQVSRHCSAAGWAGGEHGVGSENLPAKLTLFNLQSQHYCSHLAMSIQAYVSFGAHDREMHTQKHHSRTLARMPHGICSMHVLHSI